jgi:SAM-dependent methyltransferase
MSRRHYIGILIISFATLLLELALTRVLSVALWYHFGFLVISTALLGFGASGVALALWTDLRERAQLDQSLALLSIAFGIATIGSFWVMQHIPFDPFSQRASLTHDAVMLPLYYLALAFPFFWSGLAIALLLTRGADRVNRLYAADLLGAGAGCAALAVVIPFLGGSGTVMLAATFGFVAAAVFGFKEARRLALTAMTLGAIALVLAPAGDRILPVTVAASKGHSLLPAPPRPAPIYTAWNAISRVDVYPLPADPAKGWPGPGYGIVIDGGTAASGMGDLSAGVQHWLNTADYRPPGLAYIGKEHPRVLILGSGAGREVLEALYFKASSVTAVEINPIINDIVSQRMRGTFGGLFDDPAVRLVTAEGRSFVRRSNETYDVILSVQTFSNAALTAGALGMAENYMFTREAVEDYLERLSPDGVLLITRPPSQVARLFTTMREVFERTGRGSPAQHLLVFRGPLMPWGNRGDHTVFMLKKSPWTRSEMSVLLERLSADGSGAARRSPEILYSPFSDKGSGRYSDLYYEIVGTPDLARLYAAQPVDISPSTDDRPFFNQQARWSRVVLRGLNETGTTSGTEGMLILLLVQATGIAALLILIPLVRFARLGLRTAGCWSYLVYFAGLGLGFIMIEIALLQRFTLFLGEPIYAFAAILGSLLIFTGAGAYVGERLSRGAGRRVGIVLPAALAVLTATALVMPWVFNAALGLGLPLRVVLSAALVAPLGLVLGMPFPLGLVVVGAGAPGLLPWAWGVNGFFTVIGSVVAMLIGMIFGFSTVLIVAGGCYVVSLLAARLGGWPGVGSTT